MFKVFLNRANSIARKEMSLTPRWVLYSGLAVMAISLVAIISTVSYLNDAKGLLSDYNLNTSEFVISILSKKHLGLFCVSVFVISSIVTLGYFIVPWIVAFMGTIVDAIFFKESFMNVMDDNHSEGTVQSLIQSESQIEKHPDSSLTAEQRVDRIKPLIVDCFWGSSMWGYEGEDYTIRFCNSLKKILTEDNKVMKLGRIACILYDNNWTAEKWMSFKSWIIAFFNALGMKRPGDTSHNKYTYSDGGISPYSSCFGEIDKEFSYLLDQKYQGQLKKQSRPQHM